jgi:regulator of RNase E activity RraA
VPKLSPQEYTEWSNWYYNTVCTYPWEADILPGDVIVIDQSGADVGLLGSNNTQGGVIKGARGYISNGGIRDTDEIILQQVPCWSKYTAQCMVQGRLQFDAKDIPIAVGGVLVKPGDVIAADGDGVVVVPRELAMEVATYAHRELANDKRSRKAKYESLGRALDETVT